MKSARGKWGSGLSSSLSSLVLFSSLTYLNTSLYCADHQSPIIKATFPILPLRCCVMLPRSAECHAQRWFHSPCPRIVHRPIHTRYVLRVLLHVREDRHHCLSRPIIWRSNFDAGVRSISKVDGQARWVRLHQYPLDQQQAVARLQSVRGSVRQIVATDVSS